MTKIKISAIGILAVVLAVVITLFFSKPKNVVPSFVPVGAPGNMLAEQYDPYIQYNGGFNTALGITNSGDFTQSGASTLSGTVAITGTTTIAKSPDGFVAYDDFTMATGTAKAVFTNNFTSDMMCDSESGFIDAVGTSQSPSIQAAVGTSTSATGYSATLLASTTLATTTSPVFTWTYGLPFKLKAGESIVAALSDNNWIISSSTNYSNWDMEMGVHCWTMGS